MKSENVILPSYKDIAQYRSEITLNNEFQLILNDNQVTIGIRIPYRKILIQTLSRLLLTLPQVNETHFPLTLKIADGLDGSGSYQMYNQLQESVNFNTKNFIIFAYELLSIKDSYNCQIWQNTLPNSHFQIRPIALVAMKENEENVRFLMNSYINRETTEIEDKELELEQGLVKVKVIRTMFDGKMSGILTGAGGAKCQLCTASHKELHDVELIRSGYPINRTITAAKEIFSYIDEEEYLSLPSKERFGLTHQPVSDIDVISASPLHSYTCVFRWYMLLVYHIHSGSKKWSATSVKVKLSLKFVTGFLYEKTGLRIDQPSSDGGTTSTGNVARECFSNKNDLIHWISSLLPPEYHNPLAKIQNNLFAILRTFSCSREINTDALDIICRETYEFILLQFPWANITPSLHKLLAHCTELIRDCNDGYGLKDFSEEAVESCNKLIRRYREHLARKKFYTQHKRYFRTPTKS